MSDTRNKTSRGQRFLKIIGKDSASVAATKDKKALKAKAEAARAALAAWYTPGGVLKAGKAKTIGETDWLSDEHAAFVLLVADAESLMREDDHARAASQFEKARRDAQQSDAEKADRNLAKAELSKVVQQLTKLGSAHAAFAAAQQDSLALEAELTRGDPPHGVLVRMQDLHDRLTTLNAAAAAPPVSRLEQQRTKMLDTLNKLVTAEDARLGKLAYNTLPKDRVVFIEAEVRARLTDKVQPLLWGMEKPGDKAGLDEAAQIKGLTARFTEAGTKIKAAVAEVQALIEADGGASFLQAVVGKQAEERKGLDRVTARADFQAAFQPVAAALSALLDQGPDGAAALAARIEADKAQLIEKDAYAVAPGFITRWLAEIAAARAAAADLTGGAGQALGNAISALRTELSKARKAGRSRMKLAFQALIDEVDQLGAVLKTGNPGAFGAANQRLLVIRAAGITAAPQILDFTTKADRITAVTNDKAVKREFQTETNDLLLAVKTVMDALDLQAFGPAVAAFTGLDREAAALKARTDALVAWRGTVRARLTELEKQLAAFRKARPRGGPTTFGQDVATVKEGYELAGVDRVKMDKLLDSAGQSLTTVLAQLTSNPAAATALLELDALVVGAKADLTAQETQEAQEKKAKLEADLAAYATLMEATSKLVTQAKGDVEERDELVILGKQAREKFKSGAHDGARQQLRSIRPRLDALHATPGGVAVQRVEQLQKVGAMWATALGEMRSQMDLIATAAGTVATAASLDAAEVGRRMTAIHTSLEPFRAPLERSVQLLIDGRTAVPARKTAREEALGSLRAIRTALSGNPLTAKLERNPFGVSSPFAKFQRFLADVEYNALRAVPPE